MEEKGSGKEEWPRGKDNEKAAAKNNEVRSKGVCPDCGRAYGKKLWRHLRNVENWSEEKLKTTFQKKKKVCVNPLRQVRFCNN